MAATLIIYEGWQKETYLRQETRDSFEAESYENSKK